MTDALKQKLIDLAKKYEVSSFVQADPSQFLLWYKNSHDIEPACFIAAMLSFGSRTQFIPKIRSIFELADKSGGMYNWLKNEEFRKNFDENSSNFDKKGQKLPKFYRFYSFSDMNLLFLRLSEILKSSPTLGDFFKKEWEKAVEKDNQNAAPEGKNALSDVKKSSSRSSSKSKSLNLADVISENFPEAKIVPKGKNSANKRIHMFLRWMCRQNSPVDLGIWNWYPQSKLLIPLDVHVMQEGVRLGLLPQNAKADRKTAEALTNQLNQIFPGDPSRGDFALFGLGVDEEAEQSVEK